MSDNFLKEKMIQLGIKEGDIIEKFIRSSGPGGQKVNKASTCVYLKHIPTGIEVKYQRERSQPQNRFMARKLLLEKIEHFILKKEFEERQKLEKLRRQKRRRSKEVKLRILENKRRHSLKKRLRADIKDIE